MVARTFNPQIEARLKVASHEAEMVARSREQIATSLAILARSYPSLFLGDRKNEPSKDEITEP
jgi:hypothetical protein